MNLNVITRSEERVKHLGTCAKCSARMVRVEGHTPNSNPRLKGEDWGGLECPQCKSGQEATQIEVVWVAEVVDGAGNVLHWFNAKSEETARAQAEACASQPVSECEGDW